MKIGFFLVFFLFYLVSARKNEDFSRVTIKQGTLIGTVYKNHRNFYGIPYAKPPIGEQRWKNPIPDEGWEGIRDCTYTRDSCPQVKGNDPMIYPPNGTSEDCLYISIKTPIPSNMLSPVLIYIPGGGFIRASADSPGYAGELFARKGILVVTFNYRAFGGNPNDITLGGPSAGAMSVVTHLVSPISAGLFHKSIIESCHMPSGYKTMENAKDQYKRLSYQLNCTDIQCLRESKVDDILKIQTQMMAVDFRYPADAFTFWSPVIDKKILPGLPFTLFRTGRYNKVPTLVGFVELEGNYFAYGYFKTPIPQGVSSSFVKNMLDSVDDQRFKKIITHYNATVGESDDYRIALYSHINSANIYEYAKPYCTHKNCHGDEVPYVFNSFKEIGYPATEEEEKISHMMSNYWTNFIMTGDPNIGYHVPVRWPTYEPSLTADNCLNINSNAKPYNFDKEFQICDVFDEFGISGY
ncbi:hypothetical protein PPL_04075 [Heterostelium album PN500]|uniref:Carboxylic ester hydrolase n=1 Tax=Heterostelium pallidum (strain ATCC 26659 / Pp 5 / PN500) TaxID=670386 RepID=D3B5Y7_HETP5|nr:hypothetical protein PPL_04075 [Heterostelium album PN500]EFA83285.1 hypothetical protein PPL_04075 [Heterostelium album PN500]|eukprot:XP_020435402.1 hypothetical protein PPL_04075 [Heterostelium album PN500]